MPEPPEPQEGTTSPEGTEPPEGTKPTVATEPPEGTGPTVATEPPEGTGLPEGTAGRQRNPLGLIDVISAAWGIFSGNFAAIVAVVLILYVPLNAILWAANPGRVLGSQIDRLNQQQTLVDENRLDEVDTAAVARAGLALAAYAIGVEFIFTAVASAFADVGVISIAARSRQGGRRDLRTILGWSLRRWPLALVTVLLSSVLRLFLFAAFVIPGIVFSVFWLFALQAVALRGKWGLGALAYSRRCVRGNWWRVLGYGIVFLVGLGIASSIITGLNRFGDNVIAAITFSSLTAILGAYVTVAFTVLFFGLEEAVQDAQKPLVTKAY